MITEELEKRLAPLPCPFCGQLQDIIVNGHEDTEDGNSRVMYDEGYAFCNCKNIFFTKWNDGFKAVYNQDYASKYNAERAKEIVKAYKTYIPDGNGRMFFEIGAASDAMLEVASQKGWSVIGFDIMKRESKMPMVFDNFDTYETPAKFDFIFTSHVFEHFKNPLIAAKKCYDMLNDEGTFFVAMPDPWMIDFSNSIMWGHWHLREHHIMWDMDSFCDEMEKIGFTTVMKKRNFGTDFICIGDMHLIFKKEKKDGV